MTETIVLRSLSDMTLANAERLAFDQAGLALSDEAKSLIDRGRARFEAYLNGNAGYVYGSTTAPGSRAKLVLSEDAVRAQGATLRNFVASRAGPGGKLLPERCVRLALFARLSNSMTGCGKLRAGTVQAIVDMVRAPPPVPLQAVACSGEVLPLTWLMAPIADLPLNTGEAMALVNGSPFATAMVCDVALTARRRVETAERIFALGMEAIGCPAGHVDPRLADHWPDPFYGESLRRLQSLLAGSMRKPLNHQAPTSWRVLPNVLASALQALAEASRSTEIGLQSLKDNPTFLCAGEDRGPDVVVSSGGYHDHRAAKSIDQVNSALLDLCVLASRQVTHMLDGSLGKPALLARADDGVGAEYLAWVMTEPLAAARRAAEATTLDLSVQDPAGNQSDIASLGFIAYAKHRILARAVDTCMASLAMTVALALEFHDATPPRALRSLAERLGAIGRSGERRIDAVGEPLRRLTAILRASAEEMTSEERTTFFAV